MAAALGLLSSAWGSCGASALQSTDAVQGSCKVVANVDCPVACNRLDFNGFCGAHVQASCGAHCDAQATGSCLDECSSHCETDCESNATASCDARCRETCAQTSSRRCWAAADPIGCQGGEDVDCANACDQQCATNAASSCDGQCRAVCQATCKVDANIDCKINCVADAQVQCDAQFQAACQAQCSAEGVFVCGGDGAATTTSVNATANATGFQNAVPNFAIPAPGIGIATGNATGFDVDTSGPLVTTGQASSALESSGKPYAVVNGYPIPFR
jgi:hypothetical protein